jgi:hypothetical protein
VKDDLLQKNKQPNKETAGISVFSVLLSSYFPVVVIVVSLLFLVWESNAVPLFRVNSTGNSGGESSSMFFVSTKCGSCSIGNGFAVSSGSTSAALINFNTTSRNET